MFFPIKNSLTCKSIQFLLHIHGYKWNAEQSLIEKYYKKTTYLVTTSRRTVYYGCVSPKEELQKESLYSRGMIFFPEDISKISKFL